MAPAKKNHDLLKTIGAAVAAALVGGIGGAEKAKFDVRGLVEYRVGQVEGRVKELETGTRADHDEQVILKTKIVGSLERLNEKQDEAKKTTDQTARDVLSLRADVDRAKESCAKCGR